ncbi:unnamed protein product, partial [marine sediment metagenome]
MLPQYNPAKDQADHGNNVEEQGSLTRLHRAQGLVKGKEGADRGKDPEKP